MCHNGQSAALLSSSGLVMYFSTLPAPSSSAPCILTILTHLRVCVKICILTHPPRRSFNAVALILIVWLTEQRSKATEGRHLTMGDGPLWLCGVWGGETYPSFR